MSEPIDETLIRYPSDATEAHAELRRLQEVARRLRIERDRARSVSVALEQELARVLELLESSPEGWHRNSANINAAIAVLRGDDAH